MSRNIGEVLSAEDVLHRLEIQEGFQDQYCANLDDESSDEDTPEGDFTTNDGQRMLIDIDILTGKSIEKLSEFSTPAERDSLCYVMKKWGKR